MEAYFPISEMLFKVKYNLNYLKFRYFTIFINDICKESNYGIGKEFSESAYDTISKSKHSAIS